MFNTLYNLHRNSLVRRVLLPMLKRFNPGDIHLRHHYTGGMLLLHSFRHKGYWFHGRRREQETMDFFCQAIQPGDCVVEVGGHIGYLTMYFADLVGPTGHVVVFEPGLNNLPYIRSNTASNKRVILIEKAVSNQDGVAQFFEEGLTGQNNTLLSDYEVFEQNRQLSFTDANYQSRSVTTVCLDTFLADSAQIPQLIKVDIEGAEYLALEGCSRTLATHKPVVMVEVTNQKQEVYELFENLGYLLYSERGEMLRSPDKMNFNTCALHPDRHSQLLSRLGWQRSRAA